VDAIVAASVLESASDLATANVKCPVPQIRNNFLRLISQSF